MKTSESIIKISAAFLKAQKETGSAIKDSSNQFFKSKYADIGSVMEACKSALNDNGIVVLQPINGDVVETILLHDSGEWLSSETKIVCKVPNDPQAYGSAITYARRYGLQSMVFIPAEDDDGNSANGNTKPSDSKVAPASSTVAATNKCPICHATGSYHAPNCPNKEVK